MLRAPKHEFIQYLLLISDIISVSYCTIRIFTVAHLQSTLHFCKFKHSPCALSNNIFNFYGVGRHK